MPAVNGDENLRSLFAELRSRDGREAPLLEELLARPHAAGAPPRFARLLIPAGLAGAAGLVLLLWPSRSDPGPISRWRSPTASLLQSPATELMAGTPRVGESWLPTPTEVKK